MKRLVFCRRCGCSEYRQVVSNANTVKFCSNCRKTRAK